MKEAAGRTVRVRRVLDVFEQATAKLPRFQLEALVSGTRPRHDAPPTPRRTRRTWPGAVVFCVLGACVVVIAAAAAGVTL